MKQISLMLVILMIGLVSAGVTITPNTFTINTFPGETHTINVTINSDGDYTLVFNSSSPNMIITPENLTVGAGKFDTSLNLTFANDIVPGEHTFEINKVVAVTTTHQHGGGGGGGQTTTKVTTPQPQTNQTINVTNEEEPHEPIQNTTILSTTPIIRKLPIPIIVLCVIAGCGVVLIIASIIISKRNKTEVV